jgi:tight adherence protein B
MSLPWITIATFAAAALIVVAIGSLIYDVFFRYRTLLRERIEPIVKAKRGGNSSDLFDLQQLHEQLSKSKETWRSRLRGIYAQSGVRTPLLELCAKFWAVGAVATVLAFAISRQWFLIPLLAMPTFAAPLLYISARRHRRMQVLTMQLPDTFDVISRAVRAGQSIPAAFQIVADDMDAPLADEFRTCYEQQNLGMPQDVVLRDLARRTGIMELQILVVALLIQVRSGGNIVELLSNLSALVRKRLKLQMRVRAVTSEGRMQAGVLIVLPILAFAILAVFFPKYIATLIERPEILAGTATAQVIGAIWIRRIITLDV